MNNHSNKRYTEEEVQKIKKRNEGIIKKVQQWQAFPYVKPLVCKRDPRHAKLEPKERRLQVVLQCPDCGYIQYNVPPAILKTALSKPKVLLENQCKTGGLIVDVD
jgi:hypothetical protein